MSSVFVFIHSLGEPELDLVLSRLGGVGAVADVASHPAVGSIPSHSMDVNGSDRGKGKIGASCGLRAETKAVSLLCDACTTCKNERKREGLRKSLLKNKTSGAYYVRTRIQRCKSKVQCELAIRLLVLCYECRFRDKWFAYAYIAKSKLNPACRRHVMFLLSLSSLFER